MTPCLIAVRVKKQDIGRQMSIVGTFDCQFPDLVVTARHCVINGDYEYIEEKVNANMLTREFAVRNYNGCHFSLDKNYIYIYCHSDGGTKLDFLNENFNDYQSALKLMSLGSCSYVGNYTMGKYSVQGAILPYMIAPSNVGSKDWGENEPLTADDIYKEFKGWRDVHHLYVFSPFRHGTNKWKHFVN